MKPKLMTMNQIQKKGFTALSRELGPAELIRFFQMFETGSGDYTKDRHKWLKEENVKTLSEKIKRHRES